MPIICHRVVILISVMKASIILALLSLPAQTAPIAVTNPSFELPSTTTYFNSINSWSGSNGFVENCASIGFINGFHQTQCAGIDANTYTQNLGVAFAANTRYTVTLAIGNRGGFGEGLTRFGLRASSAASTNLGTATTVDNEAVVPLNTFQDFTYVFETGAVPPAGNLIAFIQGLDDGLGSSRAVFYHIRIDATPLGPATAVADSATLHLTNKVRIPVLANDTGGILPGTLAITTAPAFGTATILADSTILYAHTSGTPTADSFSYQVGNGSGQLSTATVSLHFAANLRIANSTFNVPATLPPTAFSAANAFPSISFSQPVAIATPPGESNRLFVCQKGGLIRVVTNLSGSPAANTFLDLSTGIVTSSECGVLGLAFHPAYATNGYFYVFYSHNIGGGLKQRISRFTNASPASSAAVNRNTELILIDQTDEADNHNGGDLHFGPDGYLYIAVGDEGGGDDGYNNGQKITRDLFAGILRIDVDKKPGNVAPNNRSQSFPTDAGVARFSIPIDNPFVHTTLGGTWDGSYNGSQITTLNRNDNPGNDLLTEVRSEFFITGLRNPWRMSFDSLNGELWVADVGQNLWEEISIFTKGQNGGWPYREGKSNFYRSGEFPGGTTAFNPYHTPPIYDYDHGSSQFSGVSISGGFVYRGSRYSSLYGKYIFADYSSGHIWSLQRNGTSAPTVERLTGEGGISAFGLDPSTQEILIADLGGSLQRLVTSTPGSTFPTTLSATRLFSDLTDLSPAPGLLPYSVNLPFWSDHAAKRRWITIPDGTSQFTFSQENPWTYPTGTIWVKHFDMEMQRGVPSSSKRIETRLLVKNTTGAYGVSYRWNEAGTEATLAPDEGENFNLAITQNGNPVPQTWRIPSRSECMICHTPEAGHSLSFNTRQLNLSGTIAGFSGNQLSLLENSGFFTTSLLHPNLLPRHYRPDETQTSQEARVRSYLAVNCSYCHKSGGTAPSAFDVSAPLTLAQTGVVRGTVNNNGGNPANLLIVPNAPQNSVIRHRMAASPGFGRMPAIGSNVIDQANIDLLTQWISGELPTRQTYDQWRTANFGNLTDPAGAPNADPDQDGISNHAERLAATAPKDGSSMLQPALRLAANNQLFLDMTLPNHRSFRVLSSTNLATWTPMPIPTNQGTPAPGGPIEIPLAAPITESRRFYTIELLDN